MPSAFITFAKENTDGVVEVVRRDHIQLTVVVQIANRASSNCGSSCCYGARSMLSTLLERGRTPILRVLLGCVSLRLGQNEFETREEHRQRDQRRLRRSRLETVEAHDGKVGDVQSVAVALAGAEDQTGRSVERGAVD